MNRDQFENRHRQANIQQSEIERKWRAYQEEQLMEQMRMFEAARAAAESAASAAAAAGGGGFFPLCANPSLLAGVINWQTWAPGGEGPEFQDYENFDSWTTASFPAITDVTRLVLNTGSGANAHVHSDLPYSDFTIDLYDASTSSWVTVWSNRLENPNYPNSSSGDYFFNVDVTFPVIKEVTALRLTSNPGSDQSYHDWDNAANFELYQCESAPLALQLVWSDITSTPVADPTNVDDWNSLFQPARPEGDPLYFLEVSVSGNIVNLIPSGTVQFSENLFSPGKVGNTNLLEIIDNANCVTSVGSQSLANCFKLTKAILPACTSIGFAAFISCPLTEVNFSSVESVDELGLSYLSILTTLSMPSLNIAGQYAFAASRFTSFTSTSVTEIGNFAFQGCDRLTSVDLSAAIIIGNQVFENCIFLTSILIPSCTSLGDTTSNNGVFNGIGVSEKNNINMTIDPSRLTCNSGQPDGDIVALIMGIDPAILTVNGTPIPNTWS